MTFHAIALSILLISGAPMPQFQPRAPAPRFEARVPVPIFEERTPPAPVIGKWVSKCEGGVCKQVFVLDSPVKTAAVSKLQVTTTVPVARRVGILRRFR
jgi:hypothetical protein